MSAVLPTPARPRSRPRATMLAEMRKLAVVALPLAGAQVGLVAINATDTLMLGRLGPQELAATALALSVYHPLMLFGLGLVTAAAPLGAIAWGRRDLRGLRRVFRQALWACVPFTLLVSPLFFWLAPVLEGLGQDSELAAMAQTYMRGAMWGLLPTLAATVGRVHMTTFARTGYVLAVSLAAVALNAALNYVLIFGVDVGGARVGALGLFGAGLGSTLANLFMAALLLGRLALRAPFKRQNLFGRFWRPDWQIFRKVHLVGFPIGAAILVEVSIFSGSAQLVGLIGTYELAAHQIALQWAAMTFMAPLGIGQAATARVGVAWGRGDASGARRAGFAGILLAVGFMACMAALYVTIPRTLASPFLGEGETTDTVLAFAASYLVIAGAFQLADGVQVTAINALRGLGDTVKPLLLAIFGYWVVGLGGGVALAFGLGWDGKGVWTGMALGLATMAALLTWRFWLLTKEAPPGSAATRA